jgi:Omp85 superfamily domain
LNRKILFFLLVYFLNIPLNRLYGQISTSDTLKNTQNIAEQKDIGDYFKVIFKGKTVIKKDTIKRKSLGPFYTPIVYPGYALVTGGLIAMANNISFYTHYGADAKISTILTDNVYTQYKQSINIIRSNLWLNHEKLNLLGDWRYYKFPTNTFGLGSKTSIDDANAVDYSQLRIFEVVLKQVSNNMQVGLGYSLDYHWNISETNNPVKLNTDLDKYGFSNTSVSSGITLNFQFDNRLNSNNPSEGSLINLQFKENLKALGSDNNWQGATIDLRHYIPLSAKSGNRLAFWGYNVLTLGGKPPYFDLPSTGWDTFNNTARGYVEGRFRGLNWLYLEAEYRFNLLKNGFLGGVIFTNASTLTEYSSNKFEKINPGYGLGLRIKVNKLSNTNLTIDYGFGQNGSKGFAFGLNEIF